MSRKTYSIWTSSPCSTSYWQGVLPLQKSQRFKHFSIYNIAKSSPKIFQKQQIIRPESVLHQFRRKVSECEKASKKVCKYIEAYKNNLLNQQTKKVSHTKTAKKLNKRLYSQTPKVIDNEFDRHGIRSTFYTIKGNDEQNKKSNLKKNRSVLPSKKKFMGPKIYVSGSLRIDLAKPQNFHPGPGTYFLNKIDKDAQVLYEEQTQNLINSKDQNDYLKAAESEMLETRPSTTKNISICNQENLKRRKIQLPRKSKTIYKPSTKFQNLFQ